MAELRVSQVVPIAEVALSQQWRVTQAAPLAEIHFAQQWLATQVVVLVEIGEPEEYPFFPVTKRRFGPAAQSI
ncbi:hypothetical protein [Aggregatilinea lenta]|uniref:hypothetical protein n=1 Tax=Aggregatilinea lenta TaxID=913108 RepID=UPI000E5A6190|nr:hypothetical protein [Aggregatilinea lenta]